MARRVELRGAHSHHLAHDPAQRLDQRRRGGDRDNGVEHDIKQYPDAGHAFLNDHHDLLSRAMRIVNIGYHEPSAKDARRRIISFFDAHLNTRKGQRRYGLIEPA